MDSAEQTAHKTTEEGKVAIRRLAGCTLDPNVWVVARIGHSSLWHTGEIVMELHFENVLLPQSLLLVVTLCFVHWQLLGLRLKECSGCKRSHSCLLPSSVKRRSGRKSLLIFVTVIKKKSSGGEEILKVCMFKSAVVKEYFFLSFFLLFLLSLKQNYS